MASSSAVEKPVIMVMDGALLFSAEIKPISKPISQRPTTARHASHLLQTRPKATTVVAHIRKATEGVVSPENTHPFVRDLWGETWAFAHNGDLKDFHPETGLHYRPVGQTASEPFATYVTN